MVKKTDYTYEAFYYNPIIEDICEIECKKLYVLIAKLRELQKFGMFKSVSVFRVSIVDGQKQYKICSWLTRGNDIEVNLKPLKDFTPSSDNTCSCCGQPLGLIVYDEANGRYCSNCTSLKADFN